MLISRLCLLKSMSAASMAADEGVKGHCVRARTITLIAWLSFQKESSSFSSDQNHVVLYLAHSYAWRRWECNWSGAAWVLEFTEGTTNANILDDPFPSQSGPLPGQYSSTIMTPKHFQDDQCFAKEAEIKRDGVAKHVSRPKPDWASGQKGRAEESKISNIHHLPDVLIEACKSILVMMTCEV